MRRDMDLVRQILFKMEEDKAYTSMNENYLPKVEGYTERKIFYHMKIMAQAGLLHVDLFESRTPEMEDVHVSKPQVAFYSISWEGHEFLDAARDSARWQRAMAAMGKVGGFPFPVLKELLMEFLAAELKLS